MPHGLLQQLRPERIAVFRALQVGDMLCSVPALRALRAAAPEARISLIGLPWAQWFARRYPAYIDDFIAFPGYPGLPERTPDLGALPEFFRRVRRESFDLVLQLHGSGTRTNHVAAAFGGRFLAGFRPPGTRAPQDACLLPYVDEGHESRRLLQLMAGLGAPWQGERLELPLQRGDREEIEAYPELRALDRGRYLCLHPGARDPARRWSPACFAALADALHEHTGLQVVLTGAEGEREVALAVAGRMRHRPVLAALPISLGGLAALLSDAALAVTNDTGVSHIVCALDVPSLTIFRASDPVRWAPLETHRHRWLRDAPGTALPAAVTEALDLLESRS